MKNLTTSQPKVEAIESFLEAWASRAEAVYLNILTTGQELKAKMAKRASELNTSTYVILQADPEYKAIQTEWKKHWEAQPKYIRQYSSSSLKMAIEEIEKLLAKELESKKQKLYNDVFNKIGCIIDARALYVGYDGSLNGLVIGENGKAVITTISAGGYNIQSFHYRVLVKVSK